MTSIINDYAAIAAAMSHEPQRLERNNAQPPDILVVSPNTGFFTIGPGTSVETSRANTDCAALFATLWGAGVQFDVNGVPLNLQALNNAIR